jgi:gliding motility-associated-like protein
MRRIPIKFIVAIAFFLVTFTNFVAFAQPTITSFTPTSGTVGTSVIITGTNFSTTAANNTVFFGATRASVATASATQLTVTVPTGATYAPIVVINTTTGLLAYATSNFKSTFTPNKGSISITDFDTKVDFATGSSAPSPFSVSIGDLDGDGKADMAVADFTGDTVSVFRNTSSSGIVSFASKVDFTTGTGPISVSIGDLNGDGKADMAVANYEANTVSVFRNTGSSGTINTSSFASKVDFITGGVPTSISIADLDGDGKADMAVANSASATVSVFRNTGSSGSITSSSFASKVDFATGSSPRSVSLGDLDGDGKVDMAIANAFSNTVSVLRNTSSGGSITASSFANKVDFTTGAFPYSVSIGDLDGDGKADMAIANYNINSVSVFRNTSTSGNITTSSFATKIDFTVGTFSYSVSLGDLNGDGKVDIAVANYGSGNISVLRNTSSSGSITTSSFATKVDLTAGTGAISVSIGDLDGDGKSDLAVANNGGGTVSVIRNNPVFPLAITSFTPTSAGQGATVTITGTNFTGVTSVSFGGTAVSSFNIVSSTSITAVVATGTSGSVSVSTSSPAETATQSGFIFVPAPTITSFTPTSAITGTTVTITGTNFTGATAVNFGGTAAPSFTVVSATSITAVVAAGTSGSVSVTTLGGTATGTGFVFVPALTIISFTPISGPVNTTVTITGTNFSTTPANNTVKFNGTTSVVTASTATSITTTVPVGATTGPISVTVGTGTGVSATNFTVTASPVITITTQPSDFIACVGQTATFTTAATGTTNIIYQWQFSSTLAGTYNDIVNGGGYSNVTTSTLSVNTTGNFGAGFYRCIVNGDFATTVFTNAAQLTVNAIPTAPTVVAANRCETGSVSLTASGGTNGQYKWYTLASGGTAIAGEVNSSYTTPSLSATTTYFVSVTNAGCESTRSSVTATVTTTAAPTVTGGSACPGNTLALTASGATNGQYKWYTVASGGTAIAGEVNSSYTTPILSATTTYYVTITTGACESARAPVTAAVSATGCEPVIATTKLVTQVEGKVILDLRPLITTQGTLDVNSIKVKLLPSSGAAATIANGVLTIDYKGKPFSGIESIAIEACNTNGICSQQTFDIEVAGDIVVYNAVSPNDDKLNEFFKLEYIQALSPKNQVSIYNRWGDEVFSIADYDNNTRVFAGLTNDGGKLPSGTYYYKIGLTDVGKTLTGFISLKY